MNGVQKKGSKLRSLLLPPYPAAARLNFTSTPASSEGGG